MSRLTYEDLVTTSLKKAPWKPAAVILVLETVLCALALFLFLDDWPLGKNALGSSSDALFNNLGTAGVLILFGGGLLFATLSFLVTVFSEREELRASGGFTQTQGVVTQSWLEEYMGKQGRVYQPRMLVTYSADGRQYSVAVDITQSQHNFMFIHKKTLKKYAPESPVTLYYANNNHEQAHRTLPKKGLSTLSLIVGLLFNLIPSAALGAGLLYSLSALSRALF